MNKFLLSLLASVNFISVSAFAMDGSADEHFLNSDPAPKNSHVILTLSPGESLHLTGPTHPKSTLAIKGRKDVYASEEEDSSTRVVTPETTLNIYDDTFSKTRLAIKHLAKVKLSNLTFNDGTQLETNGSDKITLKECTFQNKSSLSVFASKILVEKSKFLGGSLFMSINSFIFFNENTVDNSAIRHINSEAHFWHNILENKALIETYVHKGIYPKTTISPSLYSEQHRNYEMSAECSGPALFVRSMTTLTEADHRSQGRRIHFLPEENLGSPWKED